MAKLDTSKTEKAPDGKKKVAPSNGGGIKPVKLNKYNDLVNKKRKSDDPSDDANKAKKMRTDRPAGDKVRNGKPGDKPFKKNGFSKTPTGASKNGGTDKPAVSQKDLRLQRRQKKIGQNFDIGLNIKKIWETLRKSETTEEVRRKLCSSVFESVKGRVNQLVFAHDTSRVIECLIQYGTEKQRELVFEELKESLVEQAKSKYARFVVKKLLAYCNKEQKEKIVTAFIGKVTKLIKHSYACQIVESIYNEHANYAQRNQMLVEFYDPTLVILNDHKYKSLKDVIDSQLISKDKIMEQLKETLNSCITKTLLMFSLVHKVFVEYLENCDEKQRAEMIDTLSENLVHMVHTKDGAYVAMQCIWYGTAKDRKKIIKATKSFLLKIASEEYGHMVLLAIFDSVDDTKLVSTIVLKELLASLKQLFENDYGRKVITYLVAARDTKFFIKDYVKKLEKGDNTDTSKKDPEKRREELLEFAKPYFKEFLNKEILTLLPKGSGGIIVPLILEKLGKEGDEIVKKIAAFLLEKPYEPSSDDKTIHPIEESTIHFVIKKILEKEKNSLTLNDALLSDKNADSIKSWVSCNRGCFTIVKMIESSNDANKKRIKTLILADSELKKELESLKTQGAKLLLEKLAQI